jgi:uncharacterized repeat protein (TIGR02543 family)
MKKKILSTLLTICMLLTLLPISALAANYESWEAATAEGVTLTADTDTITIGGVSYTYKGDVSNTGLNLSTAPTTATVYKADSGYILWESTVDTDSNVTGGTLTLNGATISVTSGTALELPDVEMTIDVKEENTISGGSYGINKNSGTTTIEGSGTLTVSSAENDAISQDNDLLTITDDVTVVANSAGSIATYGIDAQKGLTISGNANVKASGDSGDIYSNSTITINTTGTVNASNIRTTHYFTYTSGTMTGSLVCEGKDNYYENFVYSVYGDFALTTDQIINSCSGEDGLTVLTGATLTIDEGVTLTVQDGTEITNKGAIVNNGTINFEDENITASTITALNLSGSGKIQIDGSNALVVGDNTYTGVTDVSSTGLDLYTDTPTEATYYTAGNGYILWKPTLDDSNAVVGGTLTLHNATINNTSGDALVLPNLPVTIEVEGKNNITSSSTGIQHPSGDTDIQGSGILNVTANGSSGILQRNNPLTITGDVTVNASATGSGSYGISAMNALTISGNADVTASGVSNGIYSNGTITVNTAGTVDAQKIYTTNDFSYQSGTLTGSWVLEGKDNYYMNLVQTVYGNFELNVDKTIRVMDDKDGLTVADGATLTIDEGVTLTVQDGTEITNNGTIVNNGAINFQDAMISAAAITALNLTGNGSVQVNGITVLVVDGEFYTPEFNISNSTLDLSTDTPATDIAFIAGNGYVLWKPTVDDSSVVTGGTLTLHNATMEANVNKALITLPTVNVTVELEGENSLTNTVDANDIIAIIEQGGTVVFDKENPVKQTPQDYTLTFSGEGTLETETNGEIPISTDGTLIIASSGNIDTGNVYTINFVMESGYLEGNLYSAGNIVIKGGTIYAGPSVCVGDFSMTGGTVTFDALESFGLRCLGTVTNTGGTMTASILNVDISTYTITYLIYGDVILLNESMPAGTTQFSTKYVVRIMNGSSLTIDSDSILYTAGNISGFTMSGVTADNIGEYIVNDGTLVNNGIILVTAETTADQVKTIADTLNISGTGTIQVYDGVDGPNNTVYTNDGTLLNVISGDITLTDSNIDSATLENDGYTWTGDSTDGYTLTLGDVYLDGNLTLPDNCSVEIHTTTDSVVNGAVQGAGVYAVDFTFTGTAPLTINGDISGFTNGDTVTVQDGARVTVNGFISIGGSGGQDGTLVVTGSGTTLSIPSTGAYAVGCDAVQVTDGAALHTSAETYSISAGTDGVSVTGGSTLTVGCDYGVYIEDGMFTLDDTSTFTANANVAAVCVVDRSGAKSQSETLNVPSSLLPSGTEITSAVGDTSGHNYTYWSIVTSGNTLSATNENSTPVTLSGAVGELTLKKASTPTPTTHYSSGGGSGSVSYVLTFQTNGGSEISNVSKTSGTTVGLSGCVPTRAGCDFAGWYSDAALTDAVTSVTLTKNTTVYAKWVEKSANPFTDVSDSSYYHDAVLWAVENNVTNGTSDTAFSPDMTCTRAQMVTFLWRTAGSPEPVSTSCPFTDVSQGAYYYKAVLWAEEQGITTGTSAVTFGSDDIVTRGQAVTLMWRGAGEPETTSANPFSDVSTDAYYYDAVLWAVENGITRGTSSVSFSPANSCTRAHIATFLYCYMGE